MAKAKDKPKESVLIPAKIEDVTPDDKNFNRGTQEGRRLLEKSLRELGAGRSILLDRNNRIIAGNKTAEEAAQIGLDDILIVETDGTKLVAVKRTDIDLDSQQGRKLALADNTVGRADLDLDTDLIAEVSADFDFDAEDWGVMTETVARGTNKEIDTDEFEDKIKMTLEFTIDENAFVSEKLSHIDANKENALLKLLGYGE